MDRPRLEANRLTGMSGLVTGSCIVSSSTSMIVRIECSSWRNKAIRTLIREILTLAHTYPYRYS